MDLTLIKSKLRGYRIYGLSISVIADIITIKGNSSGMRLYNTFYYKCEQH